MIAEGVSQLMRKPQNIDLSKNSKILRILCNTHNLMTIVDLSLRKSKYLKINFEMEQVDISKLSTSLTECYDVIISLFSSLCMNINEHKENKLNEKSMLKR